MKILKFAVVLVLTLQFSHCGDYFPSGYTLELPETPEQWVLLLGEPNWRLEWMNPAGQLQRKDIPPGKTVKIELPVTWVNPVTAWPYWPGHNLIPGFFKPAGALFPFDVSGEYLRCSWEAGPDTVFYWELAFANSDQDSRIPANFDWQRFRELFKTGVLSEAVSKDPWLVDWRNVAERTINANFDRRRLTPQAVESVKIPVHPGPWYGTSPFSAPLYFTEGDTPAFPVSSGMNVWISSAGILRVNGKTWVFTEM